MALVLTRGEPGLDSLQPLAPEPNAPPPAPLSPPLGAQEQSFLDQYRPYAEKYSAQTGIPASVYLAMGASESNWGRAGSIFGIKADPTDPNAKMYDTWEAGPHGERTPTRAAFATYASPDEAFQHFHKVLSAPRYAGALDYVKNTGNAAGFMRQINDAGYATDPHWADSIMSIASRIGGDAPHQYDPNAAPIVSRVMTDPLSAHLSDGQQAGFPAPRMPFSPYQPAPDPWAPPPIDTMLPDNQAQSDMYSPTPPRMGINPNQGGFRGPENPANLEPGPNADYGIFDYGNATSATHIPYSEQAADYLGGAVDASPAAAPFNIASMLANKVSKVAGGPDVAPTAGQVSKTFVPTNAVDATMLAAPFLGEAREGATALRGAAERAATEGLGAEAGRAPNAAATAGERLLARGNPGLEGGAFTPEERIARAKQMYQQAREQGMSDEEIAASFGQSAVDAGRGIDVAAQQDAVQAPASDAAAHAAKRVYANTLDATGDLDAASAAARKAAAAASQGIQDQVKPNLLASDDTAAQMAAARGRVRGDTGAINGTAETPQSVTNTGAGGQEWTPEERLAFGIDDAPPASDTSRPGLVDNGTAVQRDLSGLDEETLRQRLALSEKGVAIAQDRANNLQRSVEEGKSLLEHYGVGPDELTPAERRAWSAPGATEKALTDARAQVYREMAKARAYSEELAARGGANTTNGPTSVSHTGAVEDLAFGTSGATAESTGMQSIDREGNLSAAPQRAPSRLTAQEEQERKLQMGYRSDAQVRERFQQYANTSQVTEAKRYGEELYRRTNGAEGIAPSNTPTGAASEPFPASTGTTPGTTTTNAPTPVTTTTATPSGGPTGSSFTPAAGWPGGTPPTPPPGGTRLSDTLFHAASRGIQNFLDAVNGGTSLVTFGHSNIGRQGLPYAVSDLLFNSVGRGKPSIWRQSLRNFYSVLKDPATVSGIKAGLEADPWIDARGLGGVPQSLGIRYEDFVTRGAPSPDTLVKELMTKSGLQGNRVSEATHLYIDSLRKTGYSKEAQDLWNMGARDPKDYRALFDTINDATGKGVPRALGGGKVDVAGVNPMLSPGAVFGRFRSYLDPLVQPGSINPLDAGARSVAIRNLMGLGTIVGTTGGIAKLLGDDVNWDINSPLGKIPVGASTFDMSSGYGTVAKLALKGAAAIHSGDWTGLEKTVTDFLRGQLGPVPDIAVDTFTGTDWQDKDFNLYSELKSGNLASRFAPITVNAIKDAIEGNGTFKGLAIGAPSLLAVGENTNLVTAARDKATAALSKANPGLSGGKPITSYADAQNYPLLKQQVDKDPSVIEAKGSPTQYQQTADQLHKPTIDEVARQEDLFSKGQNGKKLSDVYHDAGIENRKTAEALTEQYGDQFKSIPQSAQQKLLRDYYAIDKKLPDDAATDAGGHDYEATDAARQDFVAGLPADQQQFIKEALQASENNKTPLHQEYDKYIADKKAAGYFATHVDPKSGQTVGLSAKERTALDVAHPELDVAAWKFGSVGGNAGSSLNSREAVTQALASPDAKNKEVTFAGLKRPINQSPETLAMWQYSAKPLDWYMNQLPNGQDAVNEAKRLAGSTGDKEYAKPLDQMDSKHRSVVTGNLHQAALAGSPELEAFLYVWGERNTLTTQAASDKAGQLIKQYHLNDVKAPIKKAA